MTREIIIIIIIIIICNLLTPAQFISILYISTGPENGFIRAETCSCDRDFTNKDCGLTFIYCGI